MTSASVITVPAFADAQSRIRHFFGTRRHAIDYGLEVGIPRRGIAGEAVSSWMLSVKQVHGTEALVLDRALVSTDRFVGGWDALVTDQPGIMVAVRTAVDPESITPSLAAAAAMAKSARSSAG